MNGGPERPRRAGRAANCGAGPEDLHRKVQGYWLGDAGTPLHLPWMYYLVLELPIDADFLPLRAVVCGLKVW